jgi:thioredoxin-related protein
MSIKEAKLCFVVYEKKGRCFFCLRLKKYKFRPHQSSSYMAGKVKIYYKVWINLQNSV